MNKLVLFLLFTSISIHSTAQLTIQAHAGQDKFICAGDSVQIGGSPISSNAAPPLTITWTPNTTISNNATANPMVWPSSTTTYYLSITDANGRSATDSVIVNFHIPDAVTVDSIPYTCLSDDPFQLNSGFPSGGWYSGKSISDSITFHPNLAGYGFHEITYFYTDTICNTLDSAKNPILVVLNPTITPLSINDTLCKGDTLLMKGSGGSSYEWKSNAPLSSNTGDSVLTWPDSTSFYWIIGTDTADCMDSMLFSVYVRNCETGINQLQLNREVRVYPNPFINEFDISIESTDVSSLKIINVHGQLILERTIDFNSTIHIDLNDAEDGMYILELLDQEGRVRNLRRIIKGSP